MLTKIVRSHPRDRLARKVKELNDAANEILITKIILPKKNNEMPLHPRERKKLKEQKIAVKKSEALVLDFEFDSEEILDKAYFSILRRLARKKF